MGDPTVTEEQLKQRTWKQVREANAVTQFKHADWDPNSPKSRKAFHEVEQAADQTGKDFSHQVAGDADHNWAMRPLKMARDSQAQANDHDGP